MSNFENNESVHASFGLSGKDGFVKALYKNVLDILFPVDCLGCGCPDVWLCDKCFEKIELNKNYFETIDFSPSSLDGFFIASQWQNKLLQDMIHKYKYNFVKELCPILANLLIKKMELMLDLLPDLKECILVPVPLHRKRLAWRGFNQSELLAKQIARVFGMQVQKDLVKRIKNTSPQAKLKSKARAENISNAFQKQDDLAGQKFILIDDVITTGATLNEVARVLKDAGAEKVWGMALARG